MIPVQIDKSIYRRLSKYIRYICAPTNPIYYIPYNVAIDKWNHIINKIISIVGNESDGGRLCPHPIFSNQGKYRMVQIKDLNSLSTIWDVSFEDIINEEGDIIERIVHGIELDKILASIDESANQHLSNKQTIVISESRLRRIIKEEIKKYLQLYPPCCKSYRLFLLYYKPKVDRPFRF